MKGQTGNQGEYVASVRRQLCCCCSELLNKLRETDLLCREITCRLEKYSCVVCVKFSVFSMVCALLIKKF